MFSVGIFLGAFLLFHIQPLIAKHLLPWYGATPAVWTTCMLFFQMLLVGGYAYTHLLAHRAKLVRQFLLHTTLLAAAVALLFFQWLHWDAPFLPDDAWKFYPPDQPRRSLLLMLLAGVGLPYFVLATTNPLLQKWFTHTRPGGSPYKLYVLSNLGSLAGLLAYPTIVEPLLPLRAQAFTVAALFLIYTAICTACARRALAPNASVAPLAPVPLPDLSPANGAAPARALWLLLSLCGSVLLLAVTNQLCQEVAVVPMLWVMPLALYLISFIFGFSSLPIYSRKLFFTPLVIATFFACLTLRTGLRMPLSMQIAVYGLLLFTACTLCHGELARLKPPPEKLTGFYLIIAIGGALGGVFVSLLSPLIFTGFWELHIGLLLCWTLFFIVLLRDRKSALNVGNPAISRTAFVLALIAIGIALQQGIARNDRVTIHASRNFFGTLRVREIRAPDDTSRLYRALIHGSINHGMQAQDPVLARKPVSYYTEETGVALALLNHPRRSDPGGLRIGGVGLGVGTLAAYCRTNDSLKFYEINPAVIALSYGANPVFSYLRDCPGSVEVELGDGRLQLERELATAGPANYDVLVLDAFSSDAIPIHLLTSEAMELYLRHLRRPGGILVFNVSNAYVDLLPVLHAHCIALHLDMMFVSSSGDGLSALSSKWALLTADPDVFRIDQPFANRAGAPMNEKHETRWTDHFSNLFDLLF